MRCFRLVWCAFASMAAQGLSSRDCQGRRAKRAFTVPRGQAPSALIQANLEGGLPSTMVRLVWFGRLCFVDDPRVVARRPGGLFFIPTPAVAGMARSAHKCSVECEFLSRVFRLCGDPTWSPVAYVYRGRQSGSTIWGGHGVAREARARTEFSYWPLGLRFRRRRIEISAPEVRKSPSGTE